MTTLSSQPDPDADAMLMQLAIDACVQGISAGQTPFGAAIVRSGSDPNQPTVLAVTHNHVWLNTDITAHAEVHCIRAACREAKSIDLAGYTIYSTTEPCPMCFSAIHWAKLDRIVYGASIADAATAGFSELSISNDQMKQQGGSPVLVTSGCRADECADLFRQWSRRDDRRVY